MEGLSSCEQSDRNLRSKLATIAKPALHILLSMIAEIDLALKEEDLTWEDGLRLASLHAADTDFIDSADVPKCSIVRRRQGVTPGSEHGRTGARQALSDERMPDCFTPRPDVQTCNYCFKRGHVRSLCRRLHGLCWECGSDSHLVAQCPEKFSVVQSRPFG